MNSSIRDLKQRVDNVEVPHLDVGGLIASGERRLRRRRAAITTGGVAAVLALAIGSATFAGRSMRSQEPVEQPSPSPTVEKDAPSGRQLAYAVGNTIHYGDRSIDVGEYVHFVDVTDDGAAFVRGGAFGQQPGGKPLWFTDGSEIERIGTISGSPSWGYYTAASDAGSILVWWDPTVGASGEIVVYDTGTRHELTRFPAPDAYTLDVLSVHDDALYWAPDEAPCELKGGGDDCLRYEWVMSYDVEAGSSARVSGASYDEDIRSRPRTIVKPYRADIPGTFPWDYIRFDRQGTDLVALDNGEQTTIREGLTGKPIHLSVPPDSTTATYFSLTQWLDDDQFVLFAYTGNVTEWADEGDVFTCALSSGSCRLELRGEPGTVYQMPRLD